MSDYIEREDAVNLIKKWADGYSYIEVPTKYALEEVSKIPTADVAPIRHGKWIPHIEEDYIGEGQYGYIELLKCSECGTLVPNKRNFCHHCGAKMRCDDE